MAEMEVVVPVASVDFNFDSACSSPYMTAPSSPQRFGNFIVSGPANPTRMTPFYRQLQGDSLSKNPSPSSSTSSAIPFDWEEKPGTPKRQELRKNIKNDVDYDDKDNFEFNFSGHLERTSLSADELFDGGKIKPLKSPPGYDSSVSSPWSPRSPRSSSRINQKKDSFDPFQAAIEETRRKEFKEADEDQEPQHYALQKRRGRERIPGSSNFIHKGSRSLSPLRVSDIMREQEENSSTQPTTNVKVITSTPHDGKTSYLSSILTAMSFSKGYKKWKLKDFLLFRSASEGRATSDKDSLRKYTTLSLKEVAEEDVTNVSFRSTDSVGISSSFRRRGPPVSAHEMHYTVNRAVSEEMRKKTFLPYKQGLLGGCLGLNPGMREITRGVGSLTRV